ncbi:MAG: acyl-ACP--UDP-N-acetylglucosamine O-acyltransferase [Planctomycetes bacterium]|nr:acyl-ACP--UDP-N-acetylglucosamine O-acyltransferase [Planctomycetota bacterium]
MFSRTRGVGYDSAMSMAAEMTIHPTAIVSDECVLGENVRIGPYCVIEGPVVLGPGCRLVSHVVIQGPVRIGAGVRLYPFACIGFAAQDTKFAEGDETAGVEIGEESIIREHVTVHAATKPDTPTRIGPHVFMMSGSHAGHDAQIGAHVTMMNNVAIGGHGEVGEGAVFGGGSTVHQSTRIGRLVMISGLAGTSMDVPPFCLVSDRNRMGGVNLVGMRRAGIPREQITAVRRAFSEVFRPCLPRPQMIEALTERGLECPPVAEMAQFVRDGTDARGICPGMGKPPRDLMTWLQYRRRGKVSMGPLDTTNEQD